MKIFICLFTLVVFVNDAQADGWTDGGTSVYLTTSTDNVGVGTTVPTEKITLTKGNLRMEQVAAPMAPTVAINTTSGNLNGTYYYRISFVTASGETETGTDSSAVSPTNQQVNLSNIPISADASVTARKIYRTKAGEQLVQAYLVTTLNDNTTTTYTDNLADGSLGVV